MVAVTRRRKKMRSPKIYGYGVGVICAVIAATHAPGLTHHLHWKATIIWGVIAVLAAAFSSVFFADKT
jgi:MFS-type transporter involved in bile tolerance (Atg22 family)